MREDRAARRVSVFTGEADRWGHAPLHTAIVELLHAEGCAGATVLHGVEGFGRGSRVHTESILRLSEDLPMIVMFVDTPERITALLPKVEEIAGDVPIVVEDVTLRLEAASEQD